ncbi:MAG: sulfotransferase domain-containing protein [Mariprofundaceae bacterium]|nr:sulfotransferase domain-containing protein [Mariprofundaceae bacterium]
MLFPGIVFSGQRTVMDWHACTPATEKKIRRIRKGQFCNAHLPAHPSLLDLLDREGIRAVFIIRDPRDVVISNFKYVKDMDTTHETHAHIASLADDDARLRAVIGGVDGLIAPVHELWQKNQGWQQHSATLVIRYEHLIGMKGGGDTSLQIQTLRNLAAHLDLDVSDRLIDQIAVRVFDSKSPTFRKGLTGGWRNTFSDEHVRLFKDETGDLLIRLGYEKNMDWSNS